MPLSDRLLALIRNPETPTFALRDACAEEEPPVATVYVVVGETSEWEAHESWQVAAYLEDAQAVALCDALNTWCKTHADYPRGPQRRDVRYDGTPGDLDPQFRSYDHGVTYSVVEIPLRVGEGE